MKTPTDLERENLIHLYDPQKAHEYYVRTRKLKGREPGRKPDSFGNHQGHSNDPRSGKSKGQIHKDARAKQRKELAAAIHGLERRLHKLEDLIRQRQQEDGQHKHKIAAKSERKTKEKNTPKTAAEKAKASRENKKYRDTNHQKIKQHAKQHTKSGGGSGKGGGKGAAKQHSISELKALATKVRGQLAIAKQKLAAL